MGDDGGYMDVGISKGVVFEILIVDGVDNSNIGRSHSVGYVELLKTTLVNLMSCLITPAAWGWGDANLTVGCKNSLRSAVQPARTDGGRMDAA
jgi:hypothetical protein